MCIRDSDSHWQNHPENSERQRSGSRLFLWRWNLYCRAHQPFLQGGHCCEHSVFETVWQSKENPFDRRSSGHPHDLYGLQQKKFYYGNRGIVRELYRSALPWLASGILKYRDFYTELYGIFTRGFTASFYGNDIKAVSYTHLSALSAAVHNESQE